MRLLRIASLLGVALAVTAPAFADLITLKNGRVMNGVFLGGTARQVRIEVGDNVEVVDVSDISRIEFTGYQQAPPRNEGRPTLRRNGPTIMRPDDPPARQPEASRDQPVLNPAPSGPPQSANPIEIPANTNFVVRIIDPIDSDVNQAGQTFHATMDAAIIVNNYTVVPRGADVVVKLIDEQQAGKIKGKASLTVSLWSVKVRGTEVQINTQSLSRESDSRGAKTAKMAGGGAVIGAVIGAVAGGGKGAAVGAAAGGGAGVGAEAMTKGERVRIPSETRLTFVLDVPVTI